jgi:hypothetical protein
MSICFWNQGQESRQSLGPGKSRDPGSDGLKWLEKASVEDQVKISAYLKPLGLRRTRGLPSVHRKGPGY